MPKSASNRSDAPGTVDDFADVSSPTKTSPPPLAGTPIRTLCRNASEARSNPGDLPYQNPMTPSAVHSGDADASWLPWTAVAASSSLTPGRKTMPYSSSSARCRWSSMSYPPRGEPSYPDINPAVLRPARRSARKISTGRRARACKPVNRTRSAPVGGLTSASGGDDNVSSKGSDFALFNDQPVLVLPAWSKRATHRSAAEEPGRGATGLQ